ncbi:unnamed protein product [Mytilus coruscus]|uniref:HSPA12A n=1 Tax=Mytilus coruscus TaxID=42192 RepID=A0A6J8DKP5_MYTCO|nr:unnamed protein product [Mytilus coruscus]
MDRFEEKLHSFEDGRRSIMVRWNGNNAKCISPKFIQMEHTTGAFIPSESHRGETLQSNTPSLIHVFDKMWYFVSSAVLCKSYGNQEYTEEDKEILEIPDSTLQNKNTNIEKTLPLHAEIEEDKEDNTSEDEDSGDENDLHICGWCKCEIIGLSRFFRHKLRCKRNKQRAEASHPDENFEGTGSGEYNVEIIIENVNDDWTEKAVKKKMKLQKQSHVGFRLTHKEKGSLILWTKLSATMLKDEDTFVRCLEQFLTLILRQCPLEIQTYAEIRTNITIVEWSEGYETNQDDLMTCGRCYNAFYSLNDFSDHKGLSCKKREKQQPKEVCDLVGDDHVKDETNEPEVQQEFKGETNARQLVAAIDFGTTYSGYAYCLQSDYMSDKKKLELKFPDWKIGDGRASYKAPNCVLFKSDMSFHSFGYDAINMCEIFMHKDEIDEMFYFDNFKMVLFDDKEGLTKDTWLYETFTSATGKRKKMKAIDVFAAVIHYFQHHLLEVVNILDIKDDEVYWVLTVPAIWNLKAKQFMRDAAKHAGISSQQFTLALEPEVAAMHCLRRSNLAQGTEDEELAVMNEGDKYVVLDQGGGTTDITVHQVVSKNSVKEIYQSCGGNWGGSTVSDEILKFISNFVGQDVMKYFVENSQSEYFELRHDIERMKESLSDTSSKVTIRLPISLLQAYKSVNKQSLSTDQHAGQHKHHKYIKLNKEKLRIPNEIFRSFYDPSIYRVTNELEFLFSKQEFADVKMLLAVGGFSQSNILKDAISQKLGPYIRVIVPEDPEVAVLKGAVLYGFEPEIVTARISRFTYGVAVKKIKSTEKGVQMFVSSHSEEFDIHVRKGQVLTVGHFLEEHLYVCELNEQSQVCLQFFSTEDIYPEYTTSQNCTMIGILCVDVEPSETKEVVLSVRINASETDFRASVTNNQSGSECKTSFDFYV